MYVRKRKQSADVCLKEPKARHLQGTKLPYTSIFDRHNKDFRFETIANQLFSEQCPMNFKEATAEQNWIR
jgi:hypothetical protein